MEKYLKSSKTSIIDITNVTLSINETFLWTFSELNVNVSQCRVDCIGIIAHHENYSDDTAHLMGKLEITISNSSFGTLDLEPRTKAQITDCYIDAKFKERRTLITANNSCVLIQNCHFKNIINENGTTILFGHSNSHITIENSVFIQHNSSKGVLFLRVNSYLNIRSSLFSQNIAFIMGYSTISLKDGIHAVVHDTVLRNNSAINGGALNVYKLCHVTLVNCTFSSNKAITGKTVYIPKRLEIATNSHHQNNSGTFATRNSAFSTSRHRNVQRAVNTYGQNNFEKQTNDTKFLAALPVHFLGTSFSKKQAAQLKGVSHGIGGAIFMAAHTQFFLTNCVFEDNSAQKMAGAIYADLNAILDVQGTTFVGNKAWQGGAIGAQHHAQLQITNCRFKYNSAEVLGGAISTVLNVTLNIQNITFVENRALDNGGAIFTYLNVTLVVQETNFLGNKALGYGGAIYTQRYAYLRITNCAFKNNSGQKWAGAILALFYVALNIQKTTFEGNKALQGGAIDVQLAHLRITDCTFAKNSAQQFAGAIGAAFSVTLDIRGTKFVGNKASQGGAIDAQHQTDLRITNCVFVDNISERNGGAIVGAFNTNLNVITTSFTRNRAVQGGAIEVDQQSFLRTTDCSFTDNHAKEMGGAILGSLGLVCIINRSYFLNNSALQEGGAISMQEQVNLSIAKSKLEYNVAINSGGAIVALTNVKLKIRESKFTCNRSPNAGGALAVGYHSECHVKLCVFQDNAAVTGAGGAMYSQSNSFLQVENTKFTNNNSTEGGAIHVDSNSELQTKMCSYQNNFAAQSGGAIKISSYSTAEIESCYFLANHAISGGAINSDYPEHISVRDTFLGQNIVSSTGGAVTISIGDNVTINNITCADNYATGGGGCLYINAVTLTLNNSEFSENGGQEYGAGIFIADSRIQVGTGSGIFPDLIPFIEFFIILIVLCN